MRIKLSVLLAILFLSNGVRAQSPAHDLHFDKLAPSWDEGIPLGNATLGALIWGKDGRLRFSLDRSDIWDLRPMKGLDRKEFRYSWVQEQVKKKDYGIVQEYFDTPYDKEPAPSKIPAGALEFELPTSPVRSVHLSLSGALCEIKWENGMTLKTFVHATNPVGWFRFENASGQILPRLVAPRYSGNSSGGPVNSLVGDDLSRLGYPQGIIRQDGNSITYEQQGWGGFTYQVAVEWKKIDDHTWEGVWSISSHYPGQSSTPAIAITKAAIKRGYDSENTDHLKWWKNFWGQSSLAVPDTTIEKQWYLENYKFGSASRKGAPPISLQAVWTADNGRIPPWKGDYHHDLNTQLSYWPAYSGNHLEEALAYTDHLAANTENYKRFTKLYYGVSGLAVPGVTTLTGTEMGGWVQYSLSPTVSSWLSHHFYLQWRYSMDRNFLKNTAYPWVKDVSIFLEGITSVDASGHRKLPISSSPEIYNNELRAWFVENTNYDLALMKFNFKAAAEMAEELGLVHEAERWQKIGAQFDDFALSEKKELMMAPGTPYFESHRHFSNTMAIHPLGLIKYEDGPESREIIRNTIHRMDSLGPEGWCGFSYAWLASIKARAKDGEGAARALDVFAKAFCLPNSFHVNGDQTRTGFSGFTYRPFTLEGNFAFAAGLQEMLLQSYAGFIEIMPAVPRDWKNVSFHQLRAEGAFLVDASMKAGRMENIRIMSEKGGKTELKMPFVAWKIISSHDAQLKKLDNGLVELSFGPKGEIAVGPSGDR